MSTLPLIILIALQIATPSLSTSCTDTDSLTVRNAHAMAYHGEKEVVVLFGGADDRQVVSDLWAWDGKRWECLANGGPPPRTFASLAYDVANRQLLLFGGNRVLFGSETDTPGFLNDMWAWDDGEWRQIHADMPPARAEASMVYDSNRQRLVLFGGYRMINGQIERLGDTWEWDGVALESGGGRKAPSQS